MQNKITVPVRKFNTATFATPCQKEICCDFTLVKLVWSTPVLNVSGDVIPYTEIAAGDTNAGKPTTDSVKIAKVQSCGNIVEVVLADAEGLATLKTACNKCCGDAPTTFTGTIPAVIAEVTPCADNLGDRYVRIPYPDATPIIVAATFNQTAASPSPSANYASGAAFATWATTNWSAYGTWSNDATNKVITLKLASGVNSAGIKITA